MKPTRQLAMLAAITLLVGCEKESSTPPTPPPAAPGTNAQSSLRPPTPPSPPKLEATTLPTKDEFVAAAETRLTNLTEKIGELAKQTATASSEVKAQSDQVLTALREQQSKVSSAVDELKKSSSDAWVTLKPAVEAALTELEKGFENARQKFS
ncbi:MAG: hypothetical protein EPO07_00405 [Verrucomicrobia bacterium]|nr:MAG: hypothetical protein EPO07_00405 [Verrucomicrobiota bacterium]